MRTAWHHAFPGFRPWSLKHYSSEVLKNYKLTDRQAPFAIIGDFNADGVLDVVIDGRSSSHIFHLCILSQGDGFRVLQLNRAKLYRPELWSSMYLAYVPPGTYRSPFERNPLRLLTDAFEVIVDERASTIVYLRNGVFQNYTTGD